MTILEDPAVVEEEAPLRLGEAAETAAHGAPPPPAGAEPVADAEGAEIVVSPLLACGSSFLATAAAGWVAGGVFVGTFPRLIAVLSALLGAGMVFVSYRTRVPVVVQFLVLPMAVVLGAVLVAPDATGGTANLPSLIVEALKSGGLAAPPVPFDPGWRFLLVVLISSLAVTGGTAAMALQRPRLAVFIPAPVAVAGILVQPPGTELVSVGVAFVLITGALAIAFGADLATQGTTGSAFEVRRFGRAGAMLAALVAAMIGLTQLGFLFPQEQDSRVIPPKRPDTPPPVRDRVVFRVKAPMSLPWRMGVLDVYEDNAWMTPPLDPKRFVDVPASGQILDGANVPEDKRVRVEFEITDLEGRIVPSVGGPLVWHDAPGDAEYDPRTHQFRLGGRVRGGTKYAVEAESPPDAAKLLRAGPPGAALQAFLEVPEPPREVRQLLDQIPENTPLYERLQFVRAKLYEQVVAAGPGNPVDVPPSRVADMVMGGEASPYEITAAEALLARWAGVPARVGYGYYGGESVDGALEVRPKHGAMWIEVYFEGSGWVPIVGRPPRAKSSLSQSQKNEDPQIRPTEQLGAVVHVPIRLQRITRLYMLVQYWLARIIPAGILVAAFIAFYTGALKAIRRLRRRVWANGMGPRQRVLVAYAEFRDAAIDLNIGHPTLTPIEFLDAVQPDEEHRQLAWLVTRVLWGDLRRDARSEDAAQAEYLARTLRRRLIAGQSPVMRALAVASRASLKDPFEGDIPNFWWPWSPRKKAMAFIKWLLRPVARLIIGVVTTPWRLAQRRRPTTASAALLVAVAVAAFGGCSQDVDLSKRYDPPPAVPAVPEMVSGFRFERHPEGAAAFEFYYDVSLAAAGELYAIRDSSGTAQGTLEAIVLKPGLSERDREVRRGVLDAVGSGRFKLERIAGFPVHTVRLPEQRLLLAFSPDGSSYQLLVATQGFTQAEEVFASLLSVQQGNREVTFTQVGGAPPMDPWRGP